MSSVSSAPGGVPSVRLNNPLVVILLGMLSGGIVWAANSLVTGGAEAAVVREQIAVETRRLNSQEERIARLELSTERLLTQLDYVGRSQAQLNIELREQAARAREDMRDLRRALKIPER